MVDFRTKILLFYSFPVKCSFFVVTCLLNCFYEYLNISVQNIEHKLEINVNYHFKWCHLFLNYNAHPVKIKNKNEGINGEITDYTAYQNKSKYNNQIIWIET